MPHFRTPMEPKAPLGVNDSKGQNRSKKTRRIPRNCQWVARSRIVPQEVGATRADHYLGSDYLGVNAEKTDLLKKIAIKQRFATTASNWDPEATFLPE